MSPDRGPRILRGVRTLLVIMALQGLVPGPGPGAAAAGFVGVATAPEPTFSLACDRDEGHSSSEQGCGVTLHLCECCASETVVVTAPSIVRGLHPVASLMSRAEQQPAQREPDPPFRPPIC